MIAAFARIMNLLRQAEWRRDWPLGLMFAFVVGALVIPSGTSGFHLLLLLATAVSLRLPRPSLQLAGKLFVSAILLYWSLGLLAFLIGDMSNLGERVLGRDVRILLAVPVFFLLLRQPKLPQFISPAFAFAGLVIGFEALAETAIAGTLSHRASGASLSIVFGHMAAALVAANFAILFLDRQADAFLHWMGASGAFIATLLSGTRGAVLALAIALPVLLLLAFLGRSGMTRRRFLQSSLALVVGLCLVIALAGGRIVEMFDHIERAQEGLIIDVNAAARPFEWNEADLEDFGKATMPADGETIVGWVRGVGRSAPFLRFVAGDDADVYTLPFRNPAPATEAVFLVRGKGRLSNRNTRVDIDSRDWSEIRLPPESDYETERLQLKIRKGQQLDLVPGRMIPGEWQFGGMTTSVGTRLALWTFVLTEPGVPSLLGSGLGAFPSIARAAAEQGRLPWFATEFDHAHNDYLNVLVERGVAGLLSLLLFLAVPVAIFSRALRGPGKSPEIGAAGLGFIFSIAVSAMTETMLIHSYSITYISLVVVMLVAALQVTQASQTQDSDEE